MLQVDSMQSIQSLREDVRQMSQTFEFVSKSFDQMPEKMRVQGEQLAANIEALNPKFQKTIEDAGQVMEDASRVADQLTNAMEVTDRAALSVQKISADVAVAVVDRWQRRGIGYGLLTALTALAADLGYRRLTGSVLPENTAMLALAERLAPWSRPRWDGDSVRIDIPVGPLAGTADWTITEEDVLADLLAR